MHQLYGDAGHDVGRICHLMGNAWFRSGSHCTNLYTQVFNITSLPCHHCTYECLSYEMLHIQVEEKENVQSSECSAVRMNAAVTC